MDELLKNYERDEAHVRKRLPNADEKTIDRISLKMNEILETEYARTEGMIMLMSNKSGSVWARPCENDPDSCHVEYYNEHGERTIAYSEVGSLMNAMFLEEFREAAR